MHHVIVFWHDREQYRLQQLSFQTKAAACRCVIELGKIMERHGASMRIIADDDPDLVAPVPPPMSE